jgi:acetyltransferase
MALDQAAALLAAYRIATPAGGLAPDVEGALALAEQIGYPVALKLDATGVTHKTEVGGVALDLQTPEQLRAAYAAMLRRASGLAADGEQRPVGEESASGPHPLPTVRGVYVQRMVQTKGAVELIVGVTRDPQFGPLVMAGSGGIAVELQRDVAFELAPLGAAEAGDLLDRTAAGRLLAGFRGAPPADRAAVIDAIGRLARLALDWPAIQEIEINPLLVLAQGAGAVAVDARVHLRIEQVSPGANPA